MSSRRTVPIVVSLLALFACVLLPTSSAGAKNGRNVSVSINADGGSSVDNNALKQSAAEMLCISFPGAVTATARVNGQPGATKIRCDRSSKTPPTAGAAGTRESPIPVGQAGDAGDNWSLKVTDVVANANDVVAARNKLNEPPAAGRVFFLVGIEATYTGTEPTNAVALQFRLHAIDAGNVAYDASNGCGVIPDELPIADVFQGGTVRGNVCWSVDASKTSSLVMYADRSAFGQGRTFFGVSFALS